MSQAGHYVPLAWESKMQRVERKTLLEPQSGLLIHKLTPFLQSPQLGPSFASLNRLWVQQSSNNDGAEKYLENFSPEQMERPSFHIFRQLRGWGQLKPGCGFQTEMLRDLTSDSTFLLTTILTNVIEDFKSLKGWPLLPLKQKGIHFLLLLMETSITQSLWP